MNKFHINNENFNGEKIYNTKEVNIIAVQILYYNEGTDITSLRP